MRMVTPCLTMLTHVRILTCGIQSLSTIMIRALRITFSRVDAPPPTISWLLGRRLETTVNLLPGWKLIWENLKCMTYTPKSKERQLSARRPNLISLNRFEIRKQLELRLEG